MRKNDLRGNLDLTLLTSLQSLLLDSNQLEGTLDFGSLPSEMRCLHLHKNRFNEIRNIECLEGIKGTVNISKNYIPLPKFLPDLLSRLTTCSLEILPQNAEVM